jgi:hypothetical protein
MQETGSLDHWRVPVASPENLDLSSHGQPNFDQSLSDVSQLPSLLNIPSRLSQSKDPEDVLSQDSKASFVITHCF